MFCASRTGGNSGLAETQDWQRPRTGKDPGLAETQAMLTRLLTALQARHYRRVQTHLSADKKSSFPPSTARIRTIKRRAIRNTSEQDLAFTTAKASKQPKALCSAPAKGRSRRKSSTAFKRSQTTCARWRRMEHPQRRRYKSGFGQLKALHPTPTKRRTRRRSTIAVKKVRTSCKAWLRVKHYQRRR